MLGYTDRGVQEATFKEGLVSLPGPCSEMADGADLFTGSDFEAWRLALGFASLAERASRSGRAGRELLLTLTQSSSGNLGVMPAF